MIFKISHIILAFSVFICTAGFWSNNHYCQNELTGSSILAIFGSCCSDELTPCYAMQSSCWNENGCDNKSELHKLDQYQLATMTEFKFFELLESSYFVLQPDNWHLSVVNRNNFKYSKYKPPPTVIDYQEWLQTFLC